MKLQKETAVKIGKDVSVSLFIYTLPIIALALWFQHTGETPWKNNLHQPATFNAPHFFDFIAPVFRNLQKWGFYVIAIVLGIAEFGAGLYDNKWTASERK